MADCLANPVEGRDRDVDLSIQIDASHAAEIGLSWAPDSAIIARATQEQRTIITADLDYPRLLALARANEPSLILFRGGHWSEAEVIVKMDAWFKSIAEQEIGQSIPL